jgi:predicted Zn-dependent protease with MMP-like domain
MIRISDTEFDRAAEAALAGIPAEFARYLENVLIEVRPRPDKKLMADEDVPDDALGVYLGLPLEEQGPDALHPLPDRILIFRDNLCEMCESREELIDEIRITILHEVGHHFGLDEDRLEELGYG